MVSAARRAVAELPMSDDNAAKASSHLTKADRLLRSSSGRTARTAAVTPGGPGLEAFSGMTPEAATAALGYLDRRMSEEERRIEELGKKFRTPEQTPGPKEELIAG